MSDWKEFARAAFPGQTVFKQESFPTLTRAVVPTESNSARIVYSKPWGQLFSLPPGEFFGRIFQLDNFRPSQIKHFTQYEKKKKKKKKRFYFYKN